MVSKLYSVFKMSAAIIFGAPVFKGFFMVHCSCRAAAFMQQTVLQMNCHYEESQHPVQKSSVRILMSATSSVHIIYDFIFCGFLTSSITYQGHLIILAIQQTHSYPIFR